VTVLKRIEGQAWAVDQEKPWIRYFPDLDQGSQAWLDARCGLLTASEMRHALTSTLKIADNEKTRAHVWELAAQRISRFVEPTYISDAMLRGQEDEIHARAAYEAAYGPLGRMGFITNSLHGCTLGYSPDGLVGARGLWECKSRVQKYQVETIATGEMPADFALQVQTGLLVTERDFLDFTSYSAGLPMITLRVYPDDRTHAAIIEAAQAFEAKIAEKIEAYHSTLNQPDTRAIPTERREIEEITL
jgi:hypothetical protein